MKGIEGHSEGGDSSRHGQGEGVREGEMVGEEREGGEWGSVEAIVPSQSQKCSHHSSAGTSRIITCSWRPLSSVGRFYDNAP